MADIFKTDTDREANLQHFGTFGNASVLAKKRTLAAAAVGDKIYFGVIPRGTLIYDFVSAAGALGTGVTIDFGYEKVNDEDTLTADPDYWTPSPIDYATAGFTRASAVPYETPVDVYLVATVVAASTTASGDLWAMPSYIYNGYDGT